MGSRKNERTFENVTILQLLSVGTMRKVLLQGLERFLAQRILAAWTGSGDGSLGGSGGSVGVGRSCEAFMVSCAKQDQRGGVRTHG
jgi:hypothetical protein